MTFEQTLNNCPTAYNFSREKWNKVSDVDALVASLKEAHEEATRRFVEQADTVLWMISAEKV